MKKRIVIGSFEIESNSLTAIKSVKEDFTVICGQEMCTTERISVVPYLEEHGCEVIPTLYAGSVPGGAMVREDFEAILKDLVDRIPAEGVDGMWLLLHGAMDVDEIGSGDCAIVKAVREKLGPNVPIAVAFDLHADIDPDIANYANIITGFRTAPHVDIPRTQLHAAELLLKCIDEGWLPKPLVVKVPIIAEGDSMTTDVYPGDKLIEMLWDLEKNNDMLCLNIFLGNPWVDSSCAGGAVVAIPNPGKEAVAEAAALQLAQAFWDVRDKFKFRAEHAGVEEGVAWALSQLDGPVFLTDTGDNISGGGSGDNALLLKAFLDKGAKNVLIAGIADSKVVDMCRDLQIGDSFACTIGGTLDPASVSVPVTAVLKFRGVSNNWPRPGKVDAVVLEINGIDVIVTRERTVLVHLKSFQEVHVDILSYNVVILKLGYLWPEFYDVAKHFKMIFTKGSTCEVVEDCDFHHVPRPIYPLDKDMQWKPAIVGKE